MKHESKYDNFGWVFNRPKNQFLTNNEPTYVKTPNTEKRYNIGFLMACMSVIIGPPLAIFNWPTIRSAYNTLSSWFEILISSL